MSRSATLLGFFVVCVALTPGCDDSSGADGGLSPWDASHGSVGTDGGTDGGDAGDGGEDAGMALTVLSTTPGRYSSGADVLSPLSVTFSEAVEPSGVTTETFTLKHGDVPVSGAVSVLAAVATFSPERRLALLGRYTATVSAGVRGLSGASLAESHTWSFTARDGAWGTGVYVHRQAEGPATGPRLALDAEGRMMAVWAQVDGARKDLWFSRYVPGTGWETSRPLDSTLEGTASSPELVVGSDGTLMAVWVQQREIATLLFSRYLPGTGWELPSPVDSLTGGDATIFQLASDARGQVLAVWSQFDWDTFTLNAWSARYVPGGGWSPAERIDVDPETFPGDTWEVAVAMNAAGQAVATGSRSDGVQGLVWARRYVPGTGWGALERLDDDSADATSPTAAVAADGTALLAWLQLEDGRYALWSRRYLPGTGWSAPLQIDADLGGHSIAPQARFDASGNAVVVWSQFDGRHNSLLANRFEVGTGWGTALVLEAHDSGSARIPRLAVDARGHAVAVWEEVHGPLKRIAASRYVVGQGWSPASYLDTDCAGSGSEPDVALGAAGEAVALWPSVTQGATRVCANVFE